MLKIEVIAREHRKPDQVLQVRAFGEGAWIEFALDPIVLEYAARGIPVMIALDSAEGAEPKQQCRAVGLGEPFYRCELKDGHTGEHVAMLEWSDETSEWISAEAEEP